jgi:hypothetical protein
LAISDWQFSDEDGGRDVHGTMPVAIWQEAFRWGDFRQNDPSAGPFSCRNFSASQDPSSPDPASRVRDALLARLRDRAAETTEDNDTLVEPDDSTEEVDEALDLWWRI